MILKRKFEISKTVQCENEMFYGVYTYFTQQLLFIYKIHQKLIQHVSKTINLFERIWGGVAWSDNVGKNLGHSSGLILT